MWVYFYIFYMSLNEIYITTPTPFYVIYMLVIDYYGNITIKQF